MKERCLGRLIIHRPRGTVASKERWRPLGSSSGSESQEEVQCLGPHMSQKLVSFLLALWRVLVEVRERPMGSVTADTFKDSEVSSNTRAGFHGWRGLAISGQARGHLLWKAGRERRGTSEELGQERYQNYRK